MGQRVLVLLKLIALLSAFILSAWPTMVRSQVPDCSLNQGIDFDRCLSQDGDHLALDRCCRALTQATEAGFQCLCSILLSVNNLHLTTLIPPSPLASCAIQVPSLTLCRALAPMPIRFPVELPKMLPELSYPPQRVPLEQPPVAEILKNSTMTHDSTAEEQKPHLGLMHSPRLVVSKIGSLESSAEKEAMTLVLGSLMILLAVSSWYLLA